MNIYIGFSYFLFIYLGFILLKAKTMHLIFYDLKIYGISSAKIHWFMNTEEIFISHIVSLI